MMGRRAQTVSTASGFRVDLRNPMLFCSKVRVCYLLPSSKGLQPRKWQDSIFKYRAVANMHCQDLVPKSTHHHF